MWQKMFAQTARGNDMVLMTFACGVNCGNQMKANKTPVWFLVPLSPSGQTTSGRSFLRKEYSLYV